MRRVDDPEATGPDFACVSDGNGWHRFDYSEPIGRTLRPQYNMSLQDIEHDQQRSRAWDEMERQQREQQIRADEHHRANAERWQSEATAIKSATAEDLVEAVEELIRWQTK
jgi:hypothetical protein